MSIPTMISPQEALARILQQMPRMHRMAMPLPTAHGYVVAEDIYAPIDVPPFPNATMDGYALIADDTQSASRESPVPLRVIGEIHAGSPAKTKIQPGTAMRIMTGAPVPMGADAVVMVEQTQTAGDEVLIFTPATAGQHICAAGDDVSRGQLVIPHGTRIGASEMGMCARLGMTHIPVSARPRVAILTTGNEVVDVGAQLAPGQIYNCNQYALLGQCQSAGAIPTVCIHVKDDIAAVVEAMHSVSATCDIIITSGGISMGASDHVKHALAAYGEMLFWEVAMKPGKPFAYGYLAERPVFALPGNPVSSMVTFDLFVRPALQQMTGQQPTVELATARIATAITHTPGRTEYVRATTTWHGDGYLATPTGQQGSWRLSSMVSANSYIEIPAEAGEIPAGERLFVRFIR